MKFYIGDSPKIERLRMVDNYGDRDKFAITGRFISRDLADLETATKILKKLIKEGFEIKE